MMKRKLGVHQKAMLLEALRRYSRFHRDEKLTIAWTGLGSFSQHETVYNAGLMTYATSPNPGYMTWWRLTEKGAEIVQKWLDAGYTHRNIEDDLNYYELLSQDVYYENT